MKFSISQDPIEVEPLRRELMSPGCVRVTAWFSFRRYQEARHEVFYQPGSH